MRFLLSTSSLTNLLLILPTIIIFVFHLLDSRILLYGYEFPSLFPPQTLLIVFLYVEYIEFDDDLLDAYGENLVGLKE